MMGLDGRRVYLDWNATAPLRPEARAAMLEAMDAVGNPSSVHAEGRAAKAIVEKARGQVAALVGCEPSEVVFTSGATEAAALMVRQVERILAADIEHDAVLAHRSGTYCVGLTGIRQSGIAHFSWSEVSRGLDTQSILALQGANSETGVMQPLESHSASFDRYHILHATDIAQLVGKIPSAFRAHFAAMALVSGHKIGGPAGTGALIARSGMQISAVFPGGGQEMGRRSGTENVIGIAGFGAAAEAAERDLEAGVWERVERLRDDLEDRLASAAPDLQIFGRDAPRLPNTSCFAVRGWKGETQVMQMDLGGFAVSAGSACSSGKVNKASRVLLAMGFDEVTASSAIRVSMGPTTTEAEVMAFADAWTEQYRRRRERAA
ncbi:MAG TPA: cysteine desulfurase family protein [Thermohalobaculum sp.]|nr:cysteine desulfurase family protein [Thermohalobaculum sp.]